MSREKILKIVSTQPMTIEEISLKTKVSKAYAYKVMSELREEGKVIYIPSNPITYMRMNANTRAEVIQSFNEEALILMPQATAKLEKHLLDLILSGSYDEAGVEKVRAFLNQVIGSLMFVMDVFDNPKRADRPSPEIFKRYKELAQKDQANG